MNNAKRELSQAISHVANHGFPSFGPNDVAIKCYFPALWEALFTQEELVDCLESDTGPIKTSKLVWIVQETARRLASVALDVFLGNSEETPTGGQYLSVIVYGVVQKLNHDFIVEISPDGKAKVRYLLSNSFTSENS